MSTAGDYRAEQYWKQRSMIGDRIKERVKTDMRQAHINVTALNMIRVDLPDRYEREIINTEIANQEKITYETLRDVKQTEQKTANIRAAANAAVGVINSDYLSRSTMIRNQGVGDIAKMTIEYVI